MLSSNRVRPHLHLGRETRAFLTLLAFISPWLLGFLFFVVYPVLASLYYSFTNYNVLQAPEWVGLGNYQEMLTQDPIYAKALGNTLYYVVFAVPLTTMTAFLLAVILNTRLKLRSFIRTIFFLPTVVPTVASAMIWVWVFHPRVGIANGLLTAVGLPAVGWLSSPDWSKPSLIIISVWSCGSAMLIFLAALQDVPRALYDAAKVDGASSWQSLLHVTIPMTTPAFLFTGLTGLINAFQYFTFAWILTEGGPNSSTEFYAVYLYRNAFTYFKMGYASAQAWILFVLVIVITVLLFRSSARWVYYGGNAAE
jgi:multiple sugar transport system permease protein